MAKFIAVGAGPAADLITMRGYKALLNADVILHDRLADVSSFREITAELIDVGKVPYSGHGISQAEINTLIQIYLKQGKTVVRLKGGDSVIFSRILEEIATAKEVNAEIEVIPGVTAASGAMAGLNAALTDRVASSGVIFLTGYSASGGLPEYDWRSLAASGLTLVIYMGVRHIGAISQKLTAEGMSGETPALAAYKAQSGGEKLQLMKVKDLAETEFLNPTVFIIGNVVNQAN